MVNKSKIRGTAWESANVAFLSRWWPKIKRAALEGTGDVGDLTHPEGWAVECKDRLPITLPQFLREAEAEAQNKGVPFFVALVKNRRSKGETGKIEDGYAVTRTRVWAQVAFEHEHATSTLEYLSALKARLTSDLPTGRKITPETFVALASESLYDYFYALDCAANVTPDAIIRSEDAD